VGTRLLGVGIAWDHVHCVLSLPSKIALATVVQRLKGVSAHSWNLAHPERLRWQEGYYARSVGDAELPRVLDYVANQRERHARALVNDAFEPSFDDVSDANERPGRT
jgi:putative transposase